MSEILHNYVDIPALPSALAELHWKRQELNRTLGEKALALNIASKEYNEAIVDILKINELIYREEGLL
jgi:hypothetical protein